MGIHVGIKSGGNISFVIWMNIMDRTRGGFVRHRSVSVKFKLGESVVGQKRNKPISS